MLNWQTRANGSVRTARAEGWLTYVCVFLCRLGCVLTGLFSQAVGSSF
jgi:hypothetical protein